MADLYELRASCGKIRSLLEEDKHQIGLCLQGDLTRYYTDLLEMELSEIRKAEETLKNSMGTAL